MKSILKNSNSKKIILADMNNHKEVNDFIVVLNNYKQDGMGDSPQFTSTQIANLKKHLKNYPKLFVFLAYFNDEIAGGALCFNTFSSFSTKDVINIHDICVIRRFRGLGLGRDLMNSVINLAIKLNCSKVTLEVREDNEIARKLYNSLGFNESIPVMNFWSKNLMT